MPLVRYEVRCEHSLANPELFRSAARDDPEGLLEGVAMAGLVGIVRQLGDLAEFAAEVFRDLHGELTAVGGRAHDLTVRVQQLEAELPSVEKALLSEPNQLRFAYTNGADWHASIRSDQNHCTSGELPRFVRNFYEECRGPPRLFLLDKFDVAGSGACLKRYTDPSFFKLEWASSELMKAQRAQRDKKARREKKKGRRRKTGQPIAAINQIPARVRYGSASLDDLDSLSHLLASTLKDEVASSSSIQGANHGPGTQSQKRSNLGPKTKVVGGSLPPTGALASLAVGGPSKPLKISAKDIEANTSGKFYQPSEPESVAQSMAGKISKIIEMEDRDAVPSAGLIPRNVDYKIPKGKNGSKMSDSDVEIKTANRVTKKDLEAAAMARTGRTSRGTSRSNTSMDAREGSVPGNWRTSQSSMPHVTSRSNGSVDFKEGGKFANTRASQISMPDVSPRGNVPSDAKEGLDSGVLGTASSNIPVSTELPGLQASSPRTSSLDVRDPMQSSVEVSRGTVDVKEALDASAGFSRQNSGGSNAPATSISEAFSGIEGVKEQVDEINGSEDRHGDSHRSLKPSQQHDRAHEHSFSPTVDQLQSLPNHGDVAPASDPAHGVDMQRRHSPTEAPAGDRASPFSANASEDSAMSASRSDLAIHDGHRSDVQRVTNSAVNGREVASNLEETVYKQPYLPPIRIEEIVVDEGPQMKSVASPALSSQCSSPGENLRPSTSMLSRLSYSSELVSVTSGSEPDSPVSPKSPAFNGLYLPPGSSSNISAAMSESPPEIYMGLYLRSAHHSDDSSPRHEIPVLSLSPKSPSASPFPVPWADDGDHAGPLRPPPPLPVTLPVSIPIPEDSSHFESKQVFNSAEPQFRPATSPEPNGLPSQSNGGPGYFTNLQENAEVHAEHASRTPVNPDLQESSTSNRDPGAYFGAPSAHVEQMHSSGAYLDAEVPSLSTTSSFTPEPSSSPVGLTDSSTMQSSQQRFALSSPQNSPESRNVDVPSDAPTSSTDSAIPPVEGSEADPVSQTCQDPISNPSFTDFVRSSLILPPRPSDSPSSSAHTSPLGSPKQRFQRIFLTNPIAQPVPSPLGQAMNNAPPDFSVKDEESEPSSPTGSVIIKDTPSAPGSPASIYSESDSEIHEFHPPYDEPKGSVSPRAVAHALEDIVNHGKSSSCEINGQEDRRFKSSQSGPIGAVNIQDSGLLNSASEELDSLPRDHVEVPAPHTSPHNDISHEEASFLASPPTSPHLDSGRASPRHGTEAAALRPISTTWSAPKSQNSSASNSPPDSPPKKEHLAGEDEAATLDWKDSTAKAEITRVPSTSPGRSPSNSPPTSPPKFSGRTSSLRWRKRSAPAPPEPDFSLPPNLVCRSETSSPPCSPPPHSDSESPKQWDEGSEISSSSSSSDSSRETQSEAPNVEIYRLPDSPLPPDSPTMSEEGDGNSSGSSSSSSECDEEEDATAAEYKDGRVQKTTPGLALQHPSPSSSDHKPPFEIPSSEPGVSNGNHQPSETPLRPASSFESSEESALPDSLSPQVVDITQQLSALDSQMNVSPTTDALEPPPHPLPLAPAMSTETPDTKDALAAAIAHHDWNMMKALTFQDPGHRPVPPPDERSILLDQIRTNSFSMRRTDSMERKDPLTRPSANINVAAILEKANAIRQAFVGSDDEDGDGDDWSDS